MPKDVDVRLVSLERRMKSLETELEDYKKFAATAKTSLTFMKLLKKLAMKVAGSFKLEDIGKLLSMMEKASEDEEEE